MWCLVPKRFPGNLQSVHLSGQCRTWAMKSGLFPVLVPHGSLWHVTGSPVPHSGSSLDLRCLCGSSSWQPTPLRMAPPLLQVRV